MGGRSERSERKEKEKGRRGGVCVCGGDKDAENRGRLRISLGAEYDQERRDRRKRLMLNEKTEEEEGGRCSVVMALEMGL